MATHHDDAPRHPRRLGRVQRAGTALTGLVLLLFGVLGLLSQVDFFDSRGDTVAGLGTNGALGTLSLCAGLLLLAGAAIGGPFAPQIDLVVGVAFLVSGFVNLALLGTGLNLLAFRLPNVLVSFAVGVLLMALGGYEKGRRLRHPRR
ncbi:DUF4383 domain-containing protein [Streptomyces sp. NPDC047928]|uniref:DUF4383 domain-containing protein n=1 Tax=unclassified Streptomyces TaxID=2593676 RepID=UPI003713DD98